MKSGQSRKQGNMIVKYTFDDGTVIRLLDVILSTEEIRKLQELHGKYRVESEE